MDGKIIFFILLIVNATTFNTSGNEEQYLAISKQYINPTWILNSFHLTEWPGARIFNQSVTGFFLQFISIPLFAFLAKWINFILFSIPIGRIFKTLKITNIEILFLFQLFYLNQTHGDQAFFADEWIFGEFQGKTLAYIFVFFSLSALLEGKDKKSVLFSIFASYLHILVGGWFLITSVLYFLFSKKQLKETIKLSGLYLIAMSPLIIFLGRKILVDTEKVIDGVSLNWIYVYFRHSHHVGLFHDISFFRASVFGGLRTVVISFIILALTKKLLERNELKVLSNLIFGTFGILFTFLFVAFLDRFAFDRAGSFFLQLYPFRVAAISKFMLLLFIGAAVKEYFLNNDISKKYLNIILFVIVVPYLGSRFTRNVAAIYRSPGLGYIEKPIQELSNFISKKTAREDSFFLNVQGDDQLETSFYRAIERDRYADYKLVPAGTNKLYLWYHRILASRKIKKDINHLFQMPVKPTFKYLISDKEIYHAKLVVLYKNQKYSLYQVNY